MNAAYRAARLGDAVAIAGGTYGLQVITAAPTKQQSASAPHVVFSPARGARVTIRGIQLGTGAGGRGNDGPAHITFRKLVMPNNHRDPCNIWIKPASRDITIDHVSVCSIGMDAVHGVIIENSSLGPCEATDGNCTNTRLEGNGSTDVQILHNTFHDYTTRNSDSNHFECFVAWGIGGPIGLVIRGNRFRNCAIIDIALYQEGEPLRRVLIESNFLDDPTDQGYPSGPHVPGQAAINLKDADPPSFSNLRIRFNSFAPHTGVLWSTAAGGRDTNVEAVGNIFGEVWNSCAPELGIHYAYNIYLAGRTCHGPGELAVRSLPYRSSAYGAAGNYHLRRARTVADNRVPRSIGCPKRDVDWRPSRGPRCNVGADQR